MMGLRGWWAQALAGLVVLAVGCSNPPPKPTTGTIQGTVQAKGAKDNSALVSISGQSVQAGADGTFSFSNVAPGTVTVFAVKDGYTTGTAQATVTAGQTATANISLTPANQPPVLKSVTASPATVAPGETLSVTADASDADGDTLAYSWTLPTGWTAVGATTGATVAITAPKGYAQSGLVQVAVSDGQGATVQGTALVSTENDEAPVFGSLAASPNPVTPGGTVTLAATASSPLGNSLAFTWATSATTGWTLTPNEKDPTSATLTAPAQYGASTSITVTADDGNGKTATASVVVKTLAYATSAPVLGPITAVPGWMVNPGATIALSENAQSPTGLALTYAWTIAGTGWTIHGGGATAAVTASSTAGSAALATVTVTDAAGASGEAQIALATGTTPALQAVIAGTPPLAGAVGVKLQLDGSGSTDSAGNALLVYGWYVTSSPAQSACGGNNGQACFDHANVAKPNFTPDVAGLYGIVLEVQDPVAVVTATTTTAVQVAGAAKLTVTSGGGQTGTVGQELGSPITVKLAAADGTTGIAGQQLVWAASDGMFAQQNNGVTDANGNATATIQVGRIAGPGTVTVYLQSDPTITATTGFTAVADKPASIALGSAVGDADHGVPITLTVVDKYGNPATPTTAQASASVTLTATSASKKAQFGAAATTGSITVGSGTTPTVATLSGGKFVGTLTDTTAEDVSVTIGLNAATGSPLPFSAWTTLFSSGAEAGLGRWTPAGGPPSWSAESTVVHTGSEALGLAATPVDEMNPWETSLLANVGAPPEGSVPTILSFWAETTVASAYDAKNHCERQPVFGVAVRYANGTGGGMVPPTSGYPVLDLCDNSSGSFGPLSSWTQETFDLTDYLGSYPDIELLGLNNPDPGTSLAGPSSFDVDDVLVQSLGVSSFSGATGNEIVKPGAVAKVAFSQATFGGAASVQFGVCRNDNQNQETITVQTIDKNGNVTTGTTLPIEVDWSGGTGTLSAGQPTQGTLVGIMPNGIQIQLALGQGVFTLNDTKSEAVNLAVNPLSSGLTAGAGSQMIASQWHCHDNGFGENWSDGTASSTYNSTEAIHACETEFGAGKCSTTANYAYQTSGATGCNGVDIWYFNAVAAYKDACGYNVSYLAGSTDQVYWISSCSCDAVSSPGTDPYLSEWEAPYSTWN